MEYPYLIGGFLLILIFFRYRGRGECLECYFDGREEISFLVGALIPALFLHLLNSIYVDIHATHELFALFLPIGFLIGLLIQRHIHTHTQGILRHDEFREFQIITGFLKSFFIGVLVMTEIKSGFWEELIFLLFLLAYYLIYSTSFHILHEHGKSEKFSVLHLLRALAPVYGAMTAVFFPVSSVVKVGILSFISGALIYMIVHEILPKEKETIPKYFALGFLTFFVIFVVEVLYLH